MRMNQMGSPWRRPTSEASEHWARAGHGTGSHHLKVVIPAQSVLTEPKRATASSLRRRHTSFATGIAIWGLVGMATAGSAWAVRGALFPARGDETTRSVWRNPGQVAERQPAVPTSTTRVATSTPPSLAPTTVVLAIPGSSVPDPNPLPSAPPDSPPNTSAPSRTAPAPSQLNDDQGSSNSGPGSSDDSENGGSDSSGSGSDSSGSGSGSDSSGSGSSGSGSSDDSDSGDSGKGRGRGRGGDNAGSGSDSSGSGGGSSDDSGSDSHD